MAGVRPAGGVSEYRATGRRGTRRGLLGNELANIGGLASTPAGDSRDGREFTTRTASFSWRGRKLRLVRRFHVICDADRRSGSPVPLFRNPFRLYQRGPAPQSRSSRGPRSRTSGSRSTPRSAADDVDAMHRRVTDAGVEADAPEDKPYGVRMLKTSPIPKATAGVSCGASDVLGPPVERHQHMMVAVWGSVVA